MAEIAKSTSSHHEHSACIDAYRKLCSLTVTALKSSKHLRDKNLHTEGLDARCTELITEDFGKLKEAVTALRRRFVQIIYSCFNHANF